MERLQWRSSPTFVLSTVTIGFFTDFFLYSIVVPIFPFLLQDRLSVPEYQIQLYSSGLLASYAAAVVLFSVPVGWISDKIGSRQLPFLSGLIMLLVATIMLTFGHNIFTIMVARALQGMSAVVVWTVGFAMVHDTVAPENMGQAIGTIFSLTTVSDIIAPILGGILYDRAGIMAIFGVSVGFLVINFIMRLLVVDIVTHCNPSGDNGTSEEVRPSGQIEATENDALLSHVINRRYKICGDPGKWVQAFPILYCCREPRLVMALFLTFSQSLLLGLFSATVPTEAKSLFQLSSLKVGLLFIALFVPYLILGPVASMAVDRLGTRTVATVGYAFLSPSLILLGLPSYNLIHGFGNIILFCGALVLNGMCMAFISPTSFVEASHVLEQYEAANPEFFGETSAFVQLYSFNALFLFTGLTFGPLAGGLLRATYGFGVMAIFAATFTAVIAILCCLFIGERIQTGWSYLNGYLW